MYIALTQPQVPEFRASLKLTPIATEDMKIKSHYHKQNMFFGRAMCQFFTLAWFVILIGALISHVW